MFRGCEIDGPDDIVELLNPDLFLHLERDWKPLLVNCTRNIDNDILDTQKLTYRPTSGTTWSLSLP
jgi:hypothetical protein